MKFSKMEEKENKRVSLIVDDDNPIENEKDNLALKERVKKPIIFGLMALIFIGCLYLIFKPKGDEEKSKDSGLKNVVPESTDKGLQSDKQKAYEKEMMDERHAAKRNSLMSLSDYWTSSDSSSIGGDAPLNGSHNAISSHTNPNPSLASYQNAQQTLGAFYRDDDQEKLELRRKVDQLQERLSEKDVPATPTLNDQLSLMEKSYEMAAKFLPAAGQSSGPMQVGAVADSMSHQSHKISPNEKLSNVKSMRNEVVSKLYREPDDSSFLNTVNGDRNMAFITKASNVQQIGVRNSIRAIVLENQTISDQGTVKLRLQENAVIEGRNVMRGSVMVAAAKLSGNRIQLKVSSVEVEGSILPVEILVYDLDGQMGLFVSRADEVGAAGEIAANMSQSSGMNISMSRSAGQQVVGDLSRGLIQGVSGFFGKKLRATKVSLKAGYQVLLVPKNKN